MIEQGADYLTVADELARVLRAHGWTGAVETMESLVNDAGEPSTAVSVAVGSLIYHGIDPGETAGLGEWLRGERDVLGEESDEWNRHVERWDADHAGK